MSSAPDPTAEVDLLVIGAGVNGAGIARDAAGRGLSVMLCEMDDIAEHTSSASTKLIHGGLRYLEHYDFLLVRHALQEREVLLGMAPHIIWPLRFILPHHRALRPKWLIRLGLFLYDHIGGRKRLPASRSVDLGSHPAGAPLKREYTHAFEYSDCWVQDARLVILNAMDAAERGCEVRVRTKVTGLTRANGSWQVTLHNRFSGENTLVSAKAVVNASGPWVEKTLNLDAEHASRHGVRLVKGSHVVVPKLFEHPYCYIFQNADNRIIFAIPYESDFTLLGTTDVDVGDEPGKVSIERDEIDYICRSVSEYFDVPVSKDDVVWTYSGVRPLYDDASDNASKVTRDYKLDLDTRENAPVLSVFGGKITTYRKLAEQAVDMLVEAMGRQGDAWTEGAVLPGGDFPGSERLDQGQPHSNIATYLSQCRNRWPWLAEDLLSDYMRNYGSRIERLLGDAASTDDLGRHFGGPLYQREVDYLVEHEWARSADDILWRRSKKGLHVPPATGEQLQQYLDEHYNFTTAVPMRLVS